MKLNIFLKNVNFDNNDIKIYAKKYNQNILYDENKDYSIINYEYDYLKDYFNFTKIH